MGRKSIVAVIVILALLVSGGFLIMNNNGVKHDANNSNNSSDSNSQNQPNTVQIDNFKFTQNELSVKNGTTVTWINNDPTKHNVVFDDSSAGKVEDSKFISKGEKVSFTFDTVGSFSYFCELHPYMKGTVTVTE